MPGFNPSDQASLKGVWHRGHYLHDGSVASLEKMFNPDRLNERPCSKWHPTLPTWTGHGPRKETLRVLGTASRWPGGHGTGQSTGFAVVSAFDRPPLCDFARANSALIIPSPAFSEMMDSQ